MVWWCSSTLFCPEDERGVLAGGTCWRCTSCTSRGATGAPTFSSGLPGNASIRDYNAFGLPFGGGLCLAEQPQSGRRGQCEHPFYCRTLL
eukprot:symbB.v1.2.037912.t1/scaffold5736.1/size24094/3